jgi:glycosyltransferase involved in cell wall biosynthesis
MISIITSSPEVEKIECLEKNIQQTIGVPYELIRIHNPGTMGICEAYNKGAAQAKYDVLCFVHDDVEFITPNWGLNILKHFEADANAGVLGVGGSICKCRMASAWPQPVEGSTAYSRLNILQEYKHSGRKDNHDYINPFNEERAHVITLDGVLLITKKETWRTHPFDEKLLKGFHGYDLDFTINIARKKNNYVIYDVLIAHKSEGVNNMDWFKNIFLVYNKWKNILPLCTSKQLPADEYARLDDSWFHYLLTIKAETRKERLEKLFLCSRLIPAIGIKHFRQKYFSFFKQNVLKKALLHA